jgi:hypothetical protein
MFLRREDEKVKRKGLVPEACESPVDESDRCTPRVQLFWLDLGSAAVDKELDSVNEAGIA